MATIIVIIGTVAVGIVVLVLLNKAAARPSSSPATRVQPNSGSSAPMHPSAPVYAHWLVNYNSLTSGHTENRELKVIEVQPNNRKVVAWCLTSKQEKTFLLDMMSNIRDVPSGATVDLEHWLTAYRRSRRKQT